MSGETPQDVPSIPELPSQGAATGTPTASVSNILERLEAFTAHTAERMSRLEGMQESMLEHFSAITDRLTSTPDARRQAGDREATLLAGLPSMPLHGGGQGAHEARQENRQDDARRGSQDGVRRDLQGEMSSAASPRRHDALPTSDVARGVAQETEVAEALPFVGAEEAAGSSGSHALPSNDVDGAARSELRRTHERGLRLLTRVPEDPNYERDNPALRARMDPQLEGQRLSRARVAEVMGYGPSSAPSDAAPSSRPVATVALRAPEEGKSLSLSDKEITKFTGIVEIVADQTTGVFTISGNPIDWLSIAIDRLRERRIAPSHWVAAVMPQLSDAVRQRFHAAFNSEEDALSATTLPFAYSNIIETAELVSWEDFWPWLLAEYLRPAHQDAARQMWQGMGSRQSTLARLEHDTNTFNTLLIRADLMEAIMQDDIARIRSPRLIDSYERREAYRRMLPPPVLEYVVQTEAARAQTGINTSTLGTSLLGHSRRQQASSELCLRELQEVALVGAQVRLRELTRQEQLRLAHASLHRLHAAPSQPTGWPGDPRLHALEATVHGMALTADLNADDAPFDPVRLFNAVATHMVDAPPPHVVQERRTAGQCLACGESTTHTRFTDCPHVRDQPHLVEALRDFLRRERAERQSAHPRREARVRRGRPSPPPSSSPPLTAQLHTAIAALQAIASTLNSPVGGERPIAGEEDTDEEDASQGGTSPRSKDTGRS